MYMVKLVGEVVELQHLSGVINQHLDITGCKFCTPHCQVGQGSYKRFFANFLHNKISNFWLTMALHS